MPKNAFFAKFLLGHAEGAYSAPRPQLNRGGEGREGEEEGMGEGKKGRM